MSRIPTLLLAEVDVSPNTSGLPGIAELEHIVGAMLTVALIAALGGLAIGAAAWAIGNHSTNPSMVHRGKGGVLVSFAAAALTGGAVALINFFAEVGGRLQ